MPQLEEMVGHDDKLVCTACGKAFDAYPRYKSDNVHGVEDCIRYLRDELERLRDSCCLNGRLSDD